jgi:hypothetical protein
VLWDYEICYEKVRDSMDLIQMGQDKTEKLFSLSVMTILVTLW